MLPELFILPAGC